ncbi:MAG: hypothetical protein JST59_22180 [Actinobacteria bacterium]|nr:hypothetical protein [Actinomycetota bacterium]
MWGERLRGFVGYIGRNYDAVLIITVAVGVLIVELIGSPSTQLVNAAILAVLGVVAVALLRDRHHGANLEALRQLAADAISDRPYEVVRQRNHWNIQDRRNSIITVVEQLRFTRSDVATIAQWSSGDGHVETYKAKWRRPRGQWIPAKKIHSFPVRGGEKIIYSFDEEHSRGDELHWCHERDAVDRFPTAHEGVSLSARTKSDHARVMRITWPAEDPPTHVEIRWEGKPARTLNTRTVEGRAYVEEEVAALEVGKSVEIAWTW